MIGSTYFLVEFILILSDNTYKEFRAIVKGYEEKEILPKLKQNYKDREFKDRGVQKIAVSKITVLDIDDIIE